MMYIIFYIIICRFSRIIDAIQVQVLSNWNVIAISYNFSFHDGSSKLQMLTK